MRDPASQLSRMFLRHLGLRARGGTDGGPRDLPVELHAGIERRVRQIHFVQRQIKDGLLPFRLQKHPFDEITKR